MTRYAVDGSVFTRDDARAWLAHHGLTLAYVDDTVPARAILVVQVPLWRRIVSAFGFGRSMFGLALDLQDDLEHRMPAGCRFFVQVDRWRLFPNRRGA